LPQKQGKTVSGRPIQRWGDNELNYRIERDSLGEVRVPAGAYYGATTARSLANFPIGRDRFPRTFIRSLGHVKVACAETHGALGTLESDLTDLIIRASKEVIDGVLDAQFPLVVWQTGSGTHTNMNANEVIANRANELTGKPLGTYSPIHPNDHVNLGQSSNDVIPTAMHVATVMELEDTLLPATGELREALHDKSVEWRDLLKLGRTHLMDAVPLTLGQELSGYVHQLDEARRRIEKTMEELYEVPLGGTAIGTGLNAPAGFAAAAVARLARWTKRPFKPAKNRFAAQRAHDAIVSASGTVRGLAISLMTIADDMRLLASGPRAGLGELKLPANEPGSSIMPGKVNPTQAEALTMVCAQVIGCDAAVALGGLSGHLQMNAYKPLLIHNILYAIELLAGATRSFASNCVTGMAVSTDTVSRNVERSLMLATTLTTRLGYDRVAEVAKKAASENITLKEAAVKLGYLTADEFDELVKPEKMAGDHGRTSED
jgi:fumarate hydratase class II